MSEQLQLRRGTASQVASFTGAQGECVVDIINNRLVVQDGATAGGFAAAKLSEVQTNTRTQVNDANYMALTTDRFVAVIAITAARTISLPTAASFPAGSRLLVIDESGACSATKTITLAANGTDTIDGAASAVINAPYGYLALESNTWNKWTIVDQCSSLNGLTGAVAIASSGGSTITASGSTVTIGEPGGMVNKFRNGTMDVWQRSTYGLTATTSGAYTADGWIVLPTGASVTAAQAGGRLLTKNSLQVTGAASVTDIIIKQRIESYIAAALCSQTVTIQAQIYNNTGGAITPALTVKHAGSQDTWSSPVIDVNAVNLQSCANGAWTRVAYTFAANSASYNGLEIGFDFGNNFSSSSQSIQITELDIRATPGVVPGLNSNPPPPELRPIVAELAFCQRYYITNYYGLAAPGSAYMSGYAAFQAYGTGGESAGNYSFGVTMRSVPTVTFYSPNTGAAGYLYNASAAADEASNGPNSVSMIGFAGADGTRTINDIYRFLWVASAEL